MPSCWPSSTATTGPPRRSHEPARAGPSPHQPNLPDNVLAPPSASICCRTEVAGAPAALSAVWWAPRCQPRPTVGGRSTCICAQHLLFGVLVCSNACLACITAHHLLVSELMCTNTCLLDVRLSAPVSLVPGLWSLTADPGPQTLGARSRCRPVRGARPRSAAQPPAPRPQPRHGHAGPGRRAPDRRRPPARRSRGRRRASSPA